jgi:hypothetical protein
LQIKEDLGNSEDLNGELKRKLKLLERFYYYNNNNNYWIIFSEKNVNNLSTNVKEKELIDEIG